MNMVQNKQIVVVGNRISLRDSHTKISKNTNDLKKEMSQKNIILENKGKFSVTCQRKNYTIAIETDYGYSLILLY